MKLMNILTVTALTTMTLCAPAFAQSSNCAPYEMVVDHLLDGYGESRENIAITADGMVMETFANTDTGTWTIVITNPEGLTCLAASGEGYEYTGDELQPLGDDAGFNFETFNKLSEI